MEGGEYPVDGVVDQAVGPGRLRRWVSARSVASVVRIVATTEALSAPWRRTGSNARSRNSPWVTRRRIRVRSSTSRVLDSVGYSQMTSRTTPRLTMMSLAVFGSLTPGDRARRAMSVSWRIP